MDRGVGIPVGALYQGEGRCRFRVWAPKARAVAVALQAPESRLVLLEARERGYWEALVEGVGPGARYKYRLDGQRELPDPASRSQPEGVHGPSEVVDPAAFTWSDQGWSPPARARLALYELHVGTFTPEGTFEAIIPRLGYLRQLGVNAIELMPVAQFPGARNWGYDGVYPYAAQQSYGGPAGLARLVDACHRAGLAVILDVVYNHLGPEGNYLSQFGNYFTERYQTPWGAAVNVDGPESDGVRNYFIENALYWLEALHLDGFRLDAIHAIVDQSAVPFLRQLTGMVRQRAAELGRGVVLIAESDLNDPRVIHEPPLGGLGFDAQWADDFHHALEVELIGAQSPYFTDYDSFGDLARAMRQAIVYTGQYAPRRRRHFGAPPEQTAADQFVVFIQNHDQVGNRAHGERLGQLVPLPQRKLAACAYLLSPFLPLLFMGEEYGEPHPFLYFTSHGDQRLVEAVRRGRIAEFAHFAGQPEPPDPQAEATYERSKLQLDLHAEGEHAALFRLYQALLGLRGALPALARLSKEDLEVVSRAPEKLLALHRWDGPSHALVALNLSGEPHVLLLELPVGRWVKRLDAAEARFAGPGASGPDDFEAGPLATLPLAPWAAVVYELASPDGGLPSGDAGT
ncbi:MAG TPA: malto-oligosyltrehalose trehalohydrolase [Thermomicrobiaceae bacterium]|nr:malto-oligosyltrehalose trehalohydrolase [Thermomicrobiaceae bacterium]